MRVKINLQNGFKSDEYFAINQLPPVWNQQEIDPFKLRYQPAASANWRDTDPINDNACSLILPTFRKGNDTLSQVNRNEKCQVVLK